MPASPESIDPSQLEIIYSAETIAQAVNNMAISLSARLGSEFIIVSLLKGSFVFTADLMRALHKQDCRPQIDFLTLSSYGDETETSGNVVIKQHLSESMEGKSVLLVDDILESGNTLQCAEHLVAEAGAAAVYSAVLLEKPGKRQVAFEADFIGFQCPDKFVVGYGLDYAGYFRELPYIAAISNAES